MSSKADSQVNAMSVDVEDYYQVSAFEPYIDRADWSSMPSRVEANVDRILALFDEHELSATFFTLGSFAQSHPSMLRRIVDQGHELASHGWEHRRVTSQSPAVFRDDISRSREMLQEVSGAPVLGYRAASYSIDRTNLWALDELAEAGYLYSSSTVPVRHDHYGIPDSPRFSYRAANGSLLEIPITTVPILGRNLNCGGGGWFRLYPYRFSRWALNQVNRVERQPAVFYFHPWEIDTEQPRPEGLDPKTRFRHYLNLKRMYPRLQKLLRDFAWDRMDKVFLSRDPGS